MSDLWGAVPQVRWPVSRLDQNVASGQAEPSVTANVAASSVKPLVDEPTPGIDSADTSPAGEKPVDVSRPVMSQVLSASGELNSPGESMEVVDAGGKDPTSVFGDPAGDQIEQLKAALNDDAERAKVAPRQAGGAHDVRIRVESMLDRARRLIDLGQLTEARVAAKTAHDLGHTARLDYSPEEERPIDVVQRIDDQIKESQTSATSPDERAPDMAVNAEVTRRPPRPDVDSNPRQRKDWGYGLNVFRRDRKPPSGTVPAVAAAPANSPAGNVIETLPTQITLGIEESEANDNVVVQANRRLTLVKSESPEGVDVEPYRRELELNGTVPTAPRLPRADDSGADEEQEQPTPTMDLSEESWPSETSESGRRKVRSESSTLAAADFDEVEPLQPFRDVAATPAPVRIEDEVETPTRVGQLGFAGLIACAVCAVVALFWYRRGAT